MTTEPSPAGSSRWALVVFLSALLILTLAWRGIEGLPTNDAAWYFQMGRTLAQGEGLVDQSLWHFLGRRDAIRGPGADFWLPLHPYLIAAAFRMGAYDLRTACIPNVLVLALWSGVITFLAIRQGHRPGIAALAALYTLIHPWVFGFALEPLAVAPFCLFAWSAVVVWSDASTPRSMFLSGALMGLANLSRNDAGILFGAVTLVTLATSRRRLWPYFALGFGLVMSPYLIRNTLVFGRPLPVSGRAIWFRDYADRYSWSRTPTPAAFFSEGLAPILEAKRQAYSSSYRLIFELCPPFQWLWVAVGLWSVLRSGDRRSSPMLRACAVWLLASVVLPLLNGVRGTQNSSMIFGRLVAIPLFALLMGEGLAESVRLMIPVSPARGARWSAWLMALIVLFTLREGWDFRLDNMVLARRAAAAYHAVDRVLKREHATVVMTTSPWEIQTVSQLPTVMVPDDPEPTQREVAMRFAVSHVVLGWPFSEQVCPASKSMPGYRWLTLVDRALPNVEVYRVTPPAPR